MIRTLKRLSWAVLLVLAVPCARAAEGDAGQIGSTLRLGQGARALAMGSAYSAVSDDALAVFYNPAGIAQMRRSAVGFAWRVMPLLDRKQGYVSAAVPLRDEAALGFAWIYSGVSDIVERSARGEAGETFGFHENFLSLSFAKLFGRVLAVGGSLNFVNQSFFDVNANTVGLSAGFHARFDRPHRRPFPDFLQRLSVAAALQHLGMTMRFDSKNYYEPRGQASTTTSEAFPVMGRVAAAYRLLSERTLLLSVEGTYVEDQHLRGYAGAEWAPDPRLLLRAGMAQTDPTLGFGLRQRWGKMKLALDYAFLTSPAGDDADHVVSLGVNF